MMIRGRGRGCEQNFRCVFHHLVSLFSSFSACGEENRSCLAFFGSNKRRADKNSFLEGKEGGGKRLGKPENLQIAFLIFDLIREEKSIDKSNERRSGE
jgi:hypothetical protein